MRHIHIVCHTGSAPGGRRTARPRPLPPAARWGLRSPCYSLLALSLGFGAGETAAPNPSDATRPLVFGVNRVGGSGVLHNPPGYDEDLYRKIREAGGTCVRLVASPRDIEPQRGARDWRNFDRDLDLAIRYGQTPIICIVNTPAWASPTNQATHLYPYRSDLLGEFSSFCQDLATRTRGKARLFQLWNEPNGCGWHFEDGFNHADEYLPVLAACRQGLRKGNPEAVLSLGGLDDAEGHAPIFLRKLYEEARRQGAAPGGLFDAVSDHPYSSEPGEMRAKLDALDEILRASGDGGKPFWITEYGWHTGSTAPEEQARKVAATLQAFTSNAWKYLDAAVYLCLADFEMTEDGFGLTDANLRPRPAFHAFQGAPRFGASPAFHIEPSFRSAGDLSVAWRTILPARGTVRLEAVPSEGPPPPSATKESPEGTTHRVVFEGLAPDRLYRFRIETIRRDGAAERAIATAPHEVRSPGTQAFNGGFEEGFFGGIGTGWRIEGRGFCTDAALLPGGSVAEGRHAQAVFADGAHGHGNFESTLSTVVAAAPGKALRVSYAWAALERRTLTEIKARVGLYPTAGTEEAKIAWNPWEDVGPRWKTGTAVVVPDGTAATIAIQCKLEGSLRRGSAAFLLDGVRIIDSP